MRSKVLGLLFVFSALSFSYEKNYVIKEQREVILYEVWGIVQNWGFIVEEFNHNSMPVFKGVAFIGDVFCLLKVYITLHGFDTYRLLLVYEFYELSDVGFRKTNKVGKEVFNLISAIDGSIKTKFWDKIIYEW